MLSGAVIKVDLNSVKTILDGGDVELNFLT